MPYCCGANVKPPVIRALAYKTSRVSSSTRYATYIRGDFIADLYELQTLRRRLIMSSTIAESKYLPVFTMFSE